VRFIPKQRSLCAKCQRPIVERRRKPCPDCGSLNRVIARSVEDAMPVSDKV
jgi:RNA polymerase subunit RPABC4/transcription elongation factor Spt4